MPLLASGLACSWMFVQTLPDNHQRGDHADCTTSRAMPAIDTTLALIDAGTAAYVAGRSDATNKTLAVTTGFLASAVWASSALWGYLETSACQEAKDDADTGLLSPRPILGRRQPPLLWSPPPPAPPPPAAPPPAPPAASAPDAGD
ncbi:MAG TPA: hypothetical protein VKZ18_08360 [Polyangia bacterium]|nr:hypothetical protein [Polyangia bacterium]